MTYRPNHRSGFAMVTAIFLISLCAITITLLGETIFNQARRTQMMSDDAQLRQLLLAGETFAKMQADSSPPGRISIPLPEALRQKSAELSIEFRPGSADKKIAEVEASFAHHQRSQQLTLSKQTGSWEVTEANLDQ